tara:strand:+ start:27314 stop:27739 length:426 start_codon:yes stop_codon:yes gene_type:complete
MSDSIATPDAMLDDHDSMAFYVLRNEKLALCKLESTLPYHSKRETYLACGRFSPKHKRVVFWPGAVNPSRAVQLLIENRHIEQDWTWNVSGATTRVGHKSPNTEINPKFARYDSVRKGELKNLVEKGMSIQACPKKDENSK